MTTDKAYTQKVGNRLVVNTTPLKMGKNRSQNIPLNSVSRHLLMGETPKTAVAPQRLCG